MIAHGHAACMLLVGLCQRPGQILTVGCWKQEALLTLCEGVLTPGITWRISPEGGPFAFGAALKPAGCSSGHLEAQGLGIG